ncbi:MAG: hypothetical protein FWG12_06730 [Holophagaceae bacterium]|nr:hypothetical protein [Holophagaceae bacterium]
MSTPSAPASVRSTVVGGAHPGHLPLPTKPPTSTSEASGEKAEQAELARRRSGRNGASEWELGGFVQKKPDEL